MNDFVASISYDLSTSLSNAVPWNLHLPKLLGIGCNEVFGLVFVLEICSVHYQVHIIWISLSLPLWMVIIYTNGHEQGEWHILSSNIDLIRLSNRLRLQLIDGIGAKDSNCTNNWTCLDTLILFGFQISPNKFYRFATMILKSFPKTLRSNAIISVSLYMLPHTTHFMFLEVLKKAAAH